jgi:hypothetical protein
MLLSRPFVVADAEYLTVLDDDGTDVWIRRRWSGGALIECDAHPPFVVAR